MEIKWFQGTKAWFKDDYEGFITGTLSDRKIDGDNVELTFIIEGDNEVSNIWEKKKKNYHIVINEENKYFLFKYFYLFI